MQHMFDLTYVSLLTIKFMNVHGFYNTCGTTIKLVIAELLLLIELIEAETVCLECRRILIKRESLHQFT